MISILLPNLNNRKYLEERIDSIYQQTTSEWELIIVDNYSEDGAWEFFKKVASKDTRVKISKASREGMYANWNNCIRKATGRYVYIATSDDNMSNDCFEKLSEALDQHPECGLAHCDLKLFDENSNEIPKDWWYNGLFAMSSNGYVQRRHIRKAPFDGLLHLFGATVYISITQLMIRRSLFEKVGLFPTNRGSIGDYQWVMKATMMTDTIHLPDTWGGWRQHSTQATALTGIGSPEHWQALESMSQCVLKEAKDFLVGPALNFIRSPASMSNLRKNRIRAEFATKTGWFDRLKYSASRTREDPGVVAALMLDKIKAKTGLKRENQPAGWVQFLKNHGLEPNLIALDETRG